MGVWLDVIAISQIYKKFEEARGGMPLNLVQLSNTARCKNIFNLTTLGQMLLE